MNNFGIRIAAYACLCCIVLSSCAKKLQDGRIQSATDDPRLLEVHTLTDGYLAELEQWRNGRYKSVTSPEGWLSVIGLHWLQEGENRMGSGAANDIVLPYFMGDYIGTIFVDNGMLKFNAYGESFLGNDGDQPDADGTIYHDGTDKTTVLHANSLIMYVIKRGDKYALRVKNTIAEARYGLEAIPNFEANADFIKTAKFVPVVEPTEVKVANVTGIDTDYKVSGYIQFLHQGKLHQLTAFDGGADYFFVLIKDDTAGESTYGGGRFIDVKRPEVGSIYTIVDFNKAYNPPCAFTDYATCPLPPRENYLPLSILAGEKSIKSH